MELALATTTLLLALTGGQLAVAAEEQAPLAQPAAEAPAPPPAPATVVVTADGVEHRGQIVGPAENGIELRTEIGGSQPIPLTLITRIEREEGLAAEPRALELELEPNPERIRERLTLTFDIHALSQQREALSWTSPIALLAVGALTSAAGALAFEGGSRYAVGGAGLVETLGAGVWLAVTAVEERSIDRAIEERRARLAELGRAP